MRLGADKLPERGFRIRFDKDHPQQRIRILTQDVYDGWELKVQTLGDNNQPRWVYLHLSEPIPADTMRRILLPTGKLLTSAGQWREVYRLMAWCYNTQSLGIIQQGRRGFFDQIFDMAANSEMYGDREDRILLADLRVVTTMQDKFPRWTIERSGTPTELAPEIVSAYQAQWPAVFAQLPFDKPNLTEIVAQLNAQYLEDDAAVAALEQQGAGNYDSASRQQGTLPYTNQGGFQGGVGQPQSWK